MAMGQRKNVLVVDDDDDLRSVVVETLQGAGYVADGAPGGSEALAMIGEATPALVLSDVRMGGMDGRELFRRAQDLLEASSPPFVFMTGLDTAIAGGDGLLTKPCGVAELLQAVQRYVKPAAP